ARQRGEAALETVAFISADRYDPQGCAGCPHGLLTAERASTRGRGTAGTPTAILLSGTSQITTAFAPISTLLPTLMGPSSLAPEPISTLLPITGAYFSSIRRRPTTTPSRILQLS